MTSERSIIALKGVIEQQTEQAYDDVYRLYRQLHQYPELSFREHKTGARLADALEALGYEVTRGVSRTGVGPCCATAKAQR